MKRITFNISDENYTKLKTLCEITERNKTQMITYLIKEECKKVKECKED